MDNGNEKQSLHKCLFEINKISPTFITFIMFVVLYYILHHPRIWFQVFKTLGNQSGLNLIFNWQHEYAEDWYKTSRDKHEVCLQHQTDVSRTCCDQSRPAKSIIAMNCLEMGI